MSTDSAAHEQDAQNESPEDRAAASRRAWARSTVAVGLAYAAIVLGVPTLALLTHSRSRASRSDERHQTTDADTQQAAPDGRIPPESVGIPRHTREAFDLLSLSVEVAEARQMLSHLNTVAAKWDVLLKATLTDDAGRRIGGDSELTARFLALRRVDGPPPIIDQPGPALDNLLSTAASMEQPIDNLNSQARTINQQITVWYAFHESRVQLLDDLRTAAATLPLLPMTLDATLESRESDREKVNTELANNAATAVRRDLEQSLEQLTTTRSEQEQLVERLQQQLDDVESGKAQPSTDSPIPLSTGSREDFQRESSRSKALLKPFTTPGYMQPDSGGELKSGQTKIPMSYSALNNAGALTSSEKGLATLFRLGGSRTLNQNNDRPLGSFPRMNSMAELEKPAIVADLKEAQRMLREYGSLLVADKLLSP